MRRFFILVVIAGLSTSVWAAAFEGNIDYEIHSSDGKVRKMAYQIKDPNLRVNVVKADGDVSMLFIPPEKTSYILMHKQKIAMKEPILDASTKKTPAVTGKKPEFTKTDRKETIADHECTVFTFKSDTNEGEVCNAEGMGTFFFGNAAPKAGSYDANNFLDSDIRSKGLFPLRITNKDVRAGTVMLMVATRIEEKKLPDTLFRIPAGYKIMENMSARGPAAPPNSGQPTMSQSEFVQKLAHASPEERQKMIEEMRKNYTPPPSK